MPAPRWAADLAARVCEDAGQAPVDLIWRRKRNGGDWVSDGNYGLRQYSTGRTYAAFRRVVVTAGGTRSEQAMVLLHELAHALVGPGHGHDAAFWQQAWALYRQYGLTAYALKREPSYRKLALEVAAREGVRGAKATQTRVARAERIRKALNGR